MNSYLGILVLPLFAYFLAMVSPGQNFVIVVHTTMNRSLNLGVACALGVATGSFLYATFSIFGYGLLASFYPDILLYLQILGSAYIIYIGYKIAVSKPHDLDESKSGQKFEINTYFKAYARGLMTNLSNPKSIVFFTSIFGAYVPEHSGLTVFFLLIALVLLMSVLWHSSLALFFSSNSVLRMYHAKINLINLLIGILLILIGLSVIINVAAT